MKNGTVATVFAPSIEKHGRTTKNKQIRFHFGRDRLLFWISLVAQGNKRRSVHQALLHDWVVPLTHACDRRFERNEPDVLS